MRIVPEFLRNYLNPSQIRGRWELWESEYEKVKSHEFDELPIDRIDDEFCIRFGCFYWEGERIKMEDDNDIEEWGKKQLEKMKRIGF